MDFVMGLLAQHWWKLAILLAVIVVGAFLWGWFRGTGSHEDLAGQRARSRRWASKGDVVDLTGGEDDPRRVPIGMLEGTRLYTPPLRSVMIIAPSGRARPRGSSCRQFFRTWAPAWLPA